MELAALAGLIGYSVRAEYILKGIKQQSRVPCKFHQSCYSHTKWIHCSSGLTHPVGIFQAATVFWGPWLNSKAEQFDFSMKWTLTYEQSLRHPHRCSSGGESYFFSRHNYLSVVIAYVIPHLEVSKMRTNPSGSRQNTASHWGIPTCTAQSHQIWS